MSNVSDALSRFSSRKKEEEEEEKQKRFDSSPLSSKSVDAALSRFSSAREKEKYSGNTVSDALGRFSQREESQKKIYQDDINRRNYEAKRKNEAISKINDRVTEASNKYSDYANSTSDKTFGNSFGNMVRNIGDNVTAVRNYSDTNKLRNQLESKKNIIGDSAYDEYSNYLDNLIEGYKNSVQLNDLYSSYGSEAEYNSARVGSLANDLKQADQLAYDTKSGQDDLDKMYAIRDEANKLYSNRGYSAKAYTDTKAREEFYRQNGYKDEADFNDKLTKKEVEQTQAKRVQEAQKLHDDAYNSADFSQYSEIGKKDANNSVSSLRNDPEFSNLYSENLKNGDESTKAIALDSNVLKAAKYMNEEQYSIYSYYIGKGDIETANKYIESIQDNLESQLANEIYKDYEGDALREILYGWYSGTNQFASGIESVVYGDGEYKSANATQLAGSMMRDDLGTVGQIAYDVVSTTANQVPSIMTSIVSNALLPGSGALVGAGTMGASAAGNAYQEMINAGYSKSQARTYGVMTGISETSLQYLLGGVTALGGKVSTSLINKVCKASDSAIKEFIIKFGGEMASEGLEEFMQDIIDPYMKSFATKEKLEFDEDYFANALYSGLLGALSAGFMNGVGGTIGKVYNDYSIGSTYRDSASDLVAQGLESELGTKSRTLAEQNQKLLDEGKNLSVWQIAKQVKANDSAINTEENIAKAKAEEEAKASAAEETVSSPRVETETAQKVEKPSYKVNPEGTTLYTDREGNTSQVSIDSVVKSGNNDVTFKLNNGNTAKLNQITFANEDEAILYNGLSKINLNAEGARQILNSYKDSPINPTVFINGVREGVTYGARKQNTQLMNENSLFRQLNPVQQNTAYKVGRTFTEDVTSAKQKAINQVLDSARANGAKFRRGTVSNSFDTKSMSNIQRESVKAIRFVAEKLGSRVVLYDSTTNSELAGTNGFYDPKTGLIGIDINAGDGLKGTMLYTFGHELAHQMRQFSPKSFKTFADELVKNFGKNGTDINELVAKQIEKDSSLTEDEAYEEMVADACEAMLADEKAFEKLAKMKSTNPTMFEKFKQFIQKFVSAIKSLYEGMNPDSEEGRIVKNDLKNVYDRLQSLFIEGAVKAGEAYSTISDSYDGDMTKLTPESGNIAYSLKNSKEIDEKSTDYYQQHRDDSASHISKSTFDKATNDIDTMASKMLPYLDISNNNGKRYLPEEILGKTTFSNGSYGKTIENTTICFRTLSYIDFTNEIKKKIGRPLTVEESFLASQMLYDIAVEPQCLYCYVSLDRKAYDGFLLEYIKQRDQVLDKFANIKNKSKANIDNLYQEFLDGRKDTKQMKQRFNLWINSASEGKGLISLSDLTTEEVRSQLKNGDLSAQINDAERYAQSASWAKKLEQYRSYNSDILRMSNQTVKKLNAHYGLRFYSFSEYTPAFIVENMQQIRDASLKGLYGLAYTKKTDFARIFANTGMNINISVFGKMQNGEVIPDTRQGAEWSEVQDLRDKHKNVGAVFVATSDELTEWALAQDWIDVVIPFHIVRTGANVAEFYKWTNNTQFQADKDASGKNMTISPAEHHNDLDTFKKLVKERGLTPRFDKFIDNPNYMKLVNETRLSDKESSFLTPKFDLGAAEKSFDTFVNDGGYYGDWYNKDIDYNKAVDVVASDILAGKRANEVTYGRQDINIDEQMKKIDIYKKSPSKKSHNQMLSVREVEKLDANYGNESDVRYSKKVSIEDTGSDSNKKVFNRLNSILVIPEEIKELSKSNPKKFDEWIKKNAYDPINNPNGKYEVTYRTMQVIDGNLYPPMATIDTNGNIGSHSNLFDWEAAVYDRNQEIENLLDSTIEGRAFWDKKGDGDGRIKYKPSDLVSPLSKTKFKEMTNLKGKALDTAFEEYKNSIESQNREAWKRALPNVDALNKLQNEGYVANYKLVKRPGDALFARYNPYLHSSNQILNDQFSGAYDRDNLEVIQCIVPHSEDNGEFFSDYAKDATGWNEWKSGVVASQILSRGGTERKVFLSRWLMPVRVMDSTEVANMYAGYINETSSPNEIKIPANTVSPQLLEALEKIIPNNISYSLTAPSQKKPNGEYKGSYLDRLYNQLNDKDTKPEDKPSIQQKIDHAEMMEKSINGIKYSKKDSQGNTLSKEQIEYFKDSKVRDEDGNLMVVYHGTYETFEEFEANKWVTEKNGITQIKGYFSENEEYSKNYGYTKPYYLNIKNPLDATDLWSRTLSEWKQWLKEKGVTDVELDSSIAKNTLKGGRFGDRVEYSFYEIIDSDGTWNGDGNLSERIKEAGYDGIIWEEDGRAWMPFEKEAIKDISNTKPTTNPDIRYSKKVLMGSMFSGGGTLEAGLEYQMLDKEFAVENNKQIASVYTDNHGKEHMFVGDVRDFDSKSKDNVFYLHASPVCKNFSKASHKGGEQKLDILTAEATARVLEEQMPEAFTVENVKQYKGSEAYNIIVKKLEDLGYVWDADVYKASDYGNATKRERLVIRAIKDGVLPNKPSTVESKTSWYEATKDLFDTELTPSYLVKSKIEAIKNTPGISISQIMKSDEPVLIYDTTNSKKITYAWADELAPTLTTKCGDARIVYNGRVYAPSPKFMGRLQGIPDNYKYPKAKTVAFRIIGNGIPTQLTNAVMGGVIDSAYEQTHEGKKLYSKKNSEYLELAKNPKQNKYKLQKMVDEAAKEAGYNIKAYHGTRQGTFSVFTTDTIDNNIGSHFGSKEIAEAFANGEYGNSGNNPKVYSVYLKAINPYVTYDWFGQDDFYPAFEALDIAEQIGNDEARKISDEIKSLNPDIKEMWESRDYNEGYVAKSQRETLYKDIRKLLELGGYDSIQYENGLEVLGDTNWIIQHPEQIKSADPVTYDDNGNVIPLSERFNTKNPDIRYSRKNKNAKDNRTLLTNALETVATPSEKAKLTEYKEKIDSLNQAERELADIRKKVSELWKDRKGNKDEISKLRNDATILANKIDTYDRQLVKLEATKPIKAVLEREVQSVKAQEKARYNEAMRSYRESAEKNRQDVVDRYAKYRREASERLARHDEKLREKYQDMMQRDRDRRESTKLRDKIKRYVEDFRKRLMSPTESKYIPRKLMKGIIDVYDVIDPTGENQESQAAQKYMTARQALAELKLRYDELQYVEDYNFSSEFSSEFSYRITELADAVGNTPLRDMTRDQLEDVYEILHDISVMVTYAAKQIGTEEAISNYQAGMEIIDEMVNIKQNKLTTGKVTDFFRNWTLNPLRAIREMTGFNEDSRLNKLFEALNEGRRKADTFKMESTKMFDDLRQTKEGKKNFNDAVEKTIDFGLEDVDGNSLPLTKMTAMTLALTWKREVANEGRSHLESPVKIPDAKLERKGKYQQALDLGRELIVSQEVINKINDKLSEWDKKYMDTAFKFFNEKSKNAVNETTYLTKHRVVALEKNYIPYTVNKDYIAQENENVKFDATIEGAGVLKSVKNNAKQQLIISGLNQILSKHIDTVAKIYGLTIPVKNINKALNVKQTKDDGGKSVRDYLRKTWGDALAGQDGILGRAIADVQAPRKSDSSKIFNVVKGAFVSSTLASNISVWMKQAASYPTAGSILSLKALGKGLKKYLAIKDKQSVWDEIDAHTSQHWIRRQGFSMQELGELNQSEGWQNKLNQKLGNKSPMNWIQSMDIATTAALWEASKAEVEADGITPDNENYWAEVTKLYDKVIEDTQPMYDPLHRAEITKNSGYKNFIMFQTQPLQNSGILREGAMRYRDAKIQYGKNSNQAKEALAGYKKAVASQLVSHLTFTTMTLLAAALLHRMNPYRDDEDKQVTLESVSEEYLSQLIENIFGAVVPIFGSYAPDVLDKITGQSSYDVISDPTLDKINTSLSNLSKVNTNPSFATFKNVALDVASYFGIPAKNVANLVDGLILHGKDIANGEFGSFEAGVDRTTTQNVKVMFEAYLDNNTDKFDRIISSMDVSDSTIKSGITKLVKPMFSEAYRSNDNDTMTTLRKFMKKTGYYPDVVKTTQTWIKELAK